MYCRFHFPRPVTQQTVLLFDLDAIRNRRGRFYETKRNESETMINPYNEYSMRHWKANMDSQLVCNRESVAYYVCTYICKAEPEGSRLALHAIFSDSSFTQLSNREQKVKICSAVLKHRRMEIHENMYRLGGMKLHSKSRHIAFDREFWHRVTRTSTST